MEIPIRACCGQRHMGVVCPDGMVMCCICFKRVPVDDVYEDLDGQKWDMCQSCGEREHARPE